MGIAKGLEDAGRLIPASAVYTPRTEDAEVYARNYEVFKNLYRSNKKNFEMMNGM